MNRILAPGLLAALLLAACGPVDRVDTDVAHSGVNVFFGVPKPSPPPSLPPLVIEVNPVQGFPAPVEQPPAPPVVLPSATPDPCPSLSPLSFPTQAATPVSDHPPAAATYTFRHVATLITNPDTPTQKVAQLPSTGTRQVTNVSAVGSMGNYGFDVVDTYNGFITTTSYEVYPQSVAGTLPAANPGAGVYITQVVTNDPSDASKNGTFSPTSPGVEIFAMPAAPMVTWRSAGTDPVSGTSQVVGPTSTNPQATASITADVRTNACGQPIDTWEATMSGELEYARSGPNSNVDFTLTLDMATQYGGLIVADNLVENYNDQTTGVPMRYSVGATINTLPMSPSS